MDIETIRYLVDFFDIKEFLANNRPIKLLILLGILVVMFLVVHFVCIIIKKRLEKYARIKHYAAVNPDTGKPEKGLTQNAMDLDMLDRTLGSGRLLLYLLVMGWCIQQLDFGAAYNQIVNLVFTAVCTLAGIRFIAAFVPFDMDIYFRRHGTTLKTSQTRSLMPIIKGVIWAVGLTFLLDNMGCHVSTIIAGLGIVGVAVGLAGQAILSDFFSYIVMLLDKPFQIGDFIILPSGKSGEIEYMGPKTTRLRSLDNNLVICANSELTKGTIINQGSIGEREVDLVIGVGYAVPMPVVRRVPEVMKEVVNSIPKCSFERCCMLEFGSANYNFQLIYKVQSHAGGLTEFLNIQTEVNLALQERLTIEKMNGAYPTQQLFITNNTPAPATNQHQAAAS